MIAGTINVSGPTSKKERDEANKPNLYANLLLNEPLKLSHVSPTWRSLV
jgi:hypothetical protein